MSKRQTVDGAPIDYSRVAVKYRSGIENYIEHKIRPGSFLCAVLKNDFALAVVLADSATTLDDLRKLAWWIHDYAPAGCHGNALKFNNWMKGE
jgi:hypothetical protein